MFLGFLKGLFHEIRCCFVAWMDMFIGFVIQLCTKHVTLHIYQTIGTCLSTFSGVIFIVLLDRPSLCHILTKDVALYFKLKVGILKRLAHEIFWCLFTVVCMDSYNDCIYLKGLSCQTKVKLRRILKGLFYQICVVFAARKANIPTTYVGGKIPYIS